ncbi:MAG: glycosyltransferase [Rhodocyclaceae bacterium]|nr:glycosyltransferase [Rhodocyclaceae bacterium]
MTIVVHAPNVHQGGGRTLLLALLEGAADLRAIVDQRLQLPATVSEAVLLYRAPPTLVGRLRAELALAHHAKHGDVILCFGNLPPLRGVKGKVVLFLQNRYLFNPRSTSAFPWRVRLRLAVERCWLRARIGTVDKVVVQSSSMAREVRDQFRVEATVLPFFPAQPLNEEDRECSPPEFDYDFLYVASPDPHKNHRALIEAWVLLSQIECRPSLALTVDSASAPELTRWLKPLIQKNSLRIALLGRVSPQQIDVLYAKSRALIYPSEFESFGLPLLEAASLGMPILAGELDYVRDIVEPVQTFDPTSPISISRAVERYLDIGSSKTPVLTPAQFLDGLKTLAQP